MTEKDLDKFYTNPIIVEQMFSQVKELLKEADYIIEPSAGCGYILDYAKQFNDNVYGYDLAPEREDIAEQDFLLFNPDEHNVPKTGLRVAVANPPFGKRSALAIQFFNKLTEFCDVICIIIPSSWNRYRMQNKLNKEWELKISEMLPEKSFLFKGKPYNVNCVFQVWVRPEKKETDNGIEW